PYGQFRDTWALSLSGTPGWQRLAPATFESVNVPIVSDRARDRLLLLAVYPFVSGTSSSVRELSLSAPGAGRISLNVNGPANLSASGAAVYDPMGDRFVPLGGWSCHPSEVWSLPFQEPTLTWRPLAPTNVQPPPLQGAAVAYDSRRDRVLLYGGD